MPIYNAYTNTNDMPIPQDVWEKVLGSNRPPRGGITSIIRYTNSPYYGQLEGYAVAQEYNKIFNEWVQKYNIPQSVIDEWNRQAVAQMNSDDQKKWWQRAVDSVKNTVSNIIDKGKDILQQTGDIVALAPLLPFKKMMVNVLNKKGETSISMSSKMQQIVPLFYKRVVQNQNYVSYEHADKKVTAEDVQGIIQLINPILNFITTILDKFKKKQPLSETERLVAEGSREAESNIQTQTAVQTVASDKNKMLIVGGIAAVLIIFLVSRKK